MSCVSQSHFGFSIACFEQIQYVGEVLALSKFPVLKNI